MKAEREATAEKNFHQFSNENEFETIFNHLKIQLVFRLRIQNAKLLSSSLAPPPPLHFSSSLGIFSFLRSSLIELHLCKTMFFGEIFRQKHGILFERISPF